MLTNVEAEPTSSGPSTNFDWAALAQGGSVQDALESLTSGLRKEVRGGSLQAHICAVSSAAEVPTVLEACRAAAQFREVANWSYGFRLRGTAGPDSPSEEGSQEGSEDGLDEGCGEKILMVLRRSGLQGLLVVLSRWQDFGVTPGLELYGLELYALAVDRCKDLVANIKLAMGFTQAPPMLPHKARFLKERLNTRTIDFSFLPPLPEPKVPTKFGPNHFLFNTPLNKQTSMPSLFNGGDVRLWMANGECLRHLPDSELWALRSIRQPDPLVEKTLHAVALLRGQSPVLLSGVPTARWGHLLQTLRSQTLRAELLLFDVNSVSQKTAQIVLSMLEGMNAEEVRRANAGAGVLFEWAQGVARYRCAEHAEDVATTAAPQPFGALDCQPRPRALLPAPTRHLKKPPGWERSRSGPLGIR